MDIQALRETAHLSVSGINDYLDCGLLYKLSRLDKLQPESYSDSLVLGQAVHKALAFFYRERQAGGASPRSSSRTASAIIGRAWPTAGATSSTRPVRAIIPTSMRVRACSKLSWSSFPRRKAKSWPWRSLSSLR